MKAVISGYGKMGRMVEKALAERGIECAGKSEDIRSFDPAIAKESVCIDFTVPSAIRENYRFLAENFKAVVIGTTGWDDIRDEVIAYFRAQGTAMVYASNFSIGVNVFFAVNAYFFHYKQDTDEIPVKEVKKHTVHNKRKESMSTTTVRSLSVKYRLKGSVRHERIPKARQWHVDYWGVRGHLRHYKSGKTVFIAPYTKGKERENAIGKIKV